MSEVTAFRGLREWEMKRAQAKAQLNHAEDQIQLTGHRMAESYYKSRGVRLGDVFHYTEKIKRYNLSCTQVTSEEVKTRRFRLERFEVHLYRKGSELLLRIEPITVELGASGERDRRRGAEYRELLTPDSWHMVEIRVPEWKELMAEKKEEV